MFQLNYIELFKILICFLFELKLSLVTIYFKACFYLFIYLFEKKTERAGGRAEGEGQADSC